MKRPPLMRNLLNIKKVILKFNNKNMLTTKNLFGVKSKVTFFYNYYFIIKKNGKINKKFRKGLNPQPLPGYAHDREVFSTPI